MRPMDISLKYPNLVDEKNRHGRPKLKVRIGGKRIGLKLRPGMLGFNEEYRAAVEKLRSTTALTPEPQVEQPAFYPPTSLGWLIERYFKESSDYAVMKAIGQRRRTAILGALKADMGRKHMMIPRAAIEAGVAKRSTQKAKANEWLKSIKALYSWALRVGVVDTNPAAGVRKLRIITDGYHTWTVDEIRAFVQRHPRGTMPYLALFIMLFAGLRRSDAIKLGRQHISGGTIKFRTGKTSAELVTALPWALQDAIEATTGTETRMTLLATSYGNAFKTGGAFYNWFKDRCVEAGLPHCSPHGVRKGSSTIADEEGASEDQLNAMFTWVNPNMSATYTKKASRLRLATEGFRKVEERLIREGIIVQIENGIVAPTKQVS